MDATPLADAPAPWPLAGYAPGNYTCKCNNCLGEFTGDKRAWLCLECAVIVVRAGHSLSRASLEGRVKAQREALEDARLWLLGQPSRSNCRSRTFVALLDMIDAALKDIPDA